MKNHTAQRIFWITLIVMALSFREQRESYSCHDCKALKDVHSTSILGWSVRRREATSSAGNPQIGHRHDWWRYSSAYSNGLGGVLGSGVGCHTDGRYKDGSY